MPDSRGDDEDGQGASAGISSGTGSVPPRSSSSTSGTASVPRSQTSNTRTTTKDQSASSSDASLSHTQTTTSPSAPSDPSGSVLRTTNSASSIGLESGAGLAVNPTSTPGAVSLSDPNTLTVIVVPTVVGVLVLAVLLALLFRRCRNRRRAAIDASARMEAGFETVTVPQLPTSATTTQAEQSFATKATYSIDSQSAIVAPVSAHHFSYDHSQDASPTSALYVDLPSPNHRVAWRPEKLPEIDSPGSPHSNHSRTPSMAERRTQRLMRALQDVEPPLPTAHAI